MHFAYPHVLWLLWLLPPLAGLYWIAAGRKTDALERFTEARFLDQLLPGRSQGRSLFRGALLALALTAMLTGLAGPRWGFRWEEVERRGVDLVVALDLSRSMLSEDAKPNRLAAAKREMRDLIDLLQGDRVGLVVFAGTALVQCPLTLDYGAFSVFLDQLNPNSVPIGGTDLAAAVRTATETFVKEEHSGRAVLLITDGEDHGGELRKAAEEAKAQGVHVFVVGMGSPEGVPIPDGEGGFIKEAGRVVLSKLDEAGLKELALTTGGSYVRSIEGDMDLRKIYLEDIKQTLESRSLSSSRQKRWEERYQPFLLLALLLLVLESTVGPPRRKRGASEGRAGASVPPSAAALLAAFLALASFTIPSSAEAGLFSSTDPSRLGNDAFADGRFSEALSEWLRAQTSQPSDRRLDYNVAQAHYRLEDFPAAEAAFRATTASSDPNLAADAWYGAGNSAFQQGRYPEAIAAYEECLALRPEDEDAEANRDLAQRRYEEGLEQAQEDQEQEQDEEQQEQQEQQDDAQADNQEQAEESEEGDEGEKKEQQQGQAGQTEEPPPEEPESAAENEEANEGEAEEQDQEQQPETEEMPGGAAEAADLDRQDDQTEADEEASDGAIAEETVEDESAGEGAPQVVEGALSPEQAEALLRVLESDQARRRADRTKREGQRGRRAAGKDW